MDIRLVVTGREADGKSVFVSDERVAPIALTNVPVTDWHRLWGGDETPTLPTDGTPPAQPTYFPPPGGYRIGFFTLAPDSTRPPDEFDWVAVRAEAAEKLPGMFDVNERDNPGMHTTDTVDFECVISGEVSLELDDGAERHLRAGDCVVQNGTRHAWHNRSSEPCHILVVLMGAHNEAGSAG
jgi:mannose-6-phosphate isomerase-like protein (cupin superfamily)